MPVFCDVTEVMERVFSTLVPVSLGIPVGLVVALAADTHFLLIKSLIVLHGVRAIEKLVNQMLKFTKTV